MQKYFFLLLLTLSGAKVLGQTNVTDSLTLDSIEAKWEKMIDEVTVVVHKPVVKFTTDKVNYLVKDDPDSKTQTVLEMLRKVPMVTVDGKSNISVNGSQQFLVYVDGRPSTMITRNPTKVLRSMPAGSVERIEVITNPGAKYDAEGAGGVLNIITKKSGRNSSLLSGGLRGGGLRNFREHRTPLSAHAAGDRISCSTMPRTSGRWI